MAEKKARVGFSLDFKDSKAQIDSLVKALKKVQSGFQETGQRGEASLGKLNEGMKTVFQNVSALSSNLRRGLESGQKMTRKQLSDTLSQAKSLEGKILKIHDKTVQQYTRAEGEKRKSVKSTMQAQERALNQLKRISKSTQDSLEKQKAGYGALASILAVKMSSVLRNLVEESTLLAARNEVLGTAMRTVGNNAGISNAEMERTEMTVRKLGISINDTRELISRFSQAQLGLNNATRLARASQDLAAGSTLGSSEALRVMTQSILSLLPRQLRQFGVVVNLNQVYQEQSRILGKSVNDLTSLEKRQGLLNKIFEEAAKRAGAYERSMEDAGKILTTLSSRIIPDTLSMIGQEFLPILEELVFAFKRVLEWVQKQQGGFKTLVAVLFAVGAAITSVVGAFTVFSGIVGAATGGFTGFSAAAGATLSTMGPLVLAIGAVVAALVLLPKLFAETTSAQEKELVASKGLLNIEIERAKKLKDLQGVLQNQTLTQKELKKIIEGNAKAHKVLIPFLSKETLVRADLLTTIDEEIVKNKEVLKISKERAKFAAETQLKTLEDQQKQTNSLIVALDTLQRKYGEGEVPVLVLAGALKTFQDKVEESGGSIAKVSTQMREFADENDGGMKSLIRASQRLGSSIRTLGQDIDTEFGTVVQKTIQSASDMQQAFLAIQAEYDKLTEKLTKKFPFKALAALEEERLKSISKALKGVLITEEEATDARLKVQKVFQEKTKLAELKFVEKLNSIGRTNLQKIAARRAKELEINQGSSVAIKAIEREAAVARNAIFIKMWDDRLNIAKKSTDTLVGVVRADRDLAIQIAQSKAGIIINSEKLGSKSRIEGMIGFSKKSLMILTKSKSAEIQTRINFRNKILDIVKGAQEEETILRQKGFKATSEQLAILFEKGAINEQQFNERSKALATELKNFKQSQIQERVVFLKSSLDEMLAAEISINQKLKEIELSRVEGVRATQDTIRQIRQQGQTDIENFDEDRRLAAQLLAEAQVAIEEGNFARVKEINSKVKALALSTSKEVVETSGENTKVLISADEARIGSIKLVEEAGYILQQSFTAQREEEEKALSKVKSKILDISKTIKLLISEKKEIELEVIGNAEKDINIIQQKLDNLKDKTVTVTVITRNIGGGGGGEAGDASSTPASAPALASGAVNIQGPGTNTSDSIVAMLSKGESVVNAAATQMFTPLLELMNTNPDKLRNIIAPNVTGGAGGGTINNVSDSTEVGAVNITINGVDSKEVPNVNWKRVVRDEIAPELNKLNRRKPSI